MKRILFPILTALALVGPISPSAADAASLATAQASTKPDGSTGKKKTKKKKEAKKKAKKKKARKRKKAKKKAPGKTITRTIKVSYTFADGEGPKPKLTSPTPGESEYAECPWSDAVCIAEEIAECAQSGDEFVCNDEGCTCITGCASGDC